MGEDNEPKLHALVVCRFYGDPRNDDFIECRSCPHKGIHVYQPHCLTPCRIEESTCRKLKLDEEMDWFGRNRANEYCSEGLGHKLK
jgi:hypothetical protein